MKKQKNHPKKKEFSVNEKQFSAEDSKLILDLLNSAIQLPINLYLEQLARTNAQNTIFEANIQYLKTSNGIPELPLFIEPVNEKVEITNNHHYFKKNNNLKNKKSLASSTTRPPFKYLKK